MPFKPLLNALKRHGLAVSAVGRMKQRARPQTSEQTIDLWDSTEIAWDIDIGLKHRLLKLFELCDHDMSGSIDLVAELLKLARHSAHLAWSSMQLPVGAQQIDELVVICKHQLSKGRGVDSVMFLNTVIPCYGFPLQDGTEPEDTCIKLALHDAAAVSSDEPGVGEHGMGNLLDWWMERFGESYFETKLNAEQQHLGKEVYFAVESRKSLESDRAENMVQWREAVKHDSDWAPEEEMDLLLKSKIDVARHEEAVAEQKLILALGDTCWMCMEHHSCISQDSRLWKAASGWYTEWWWLQIVLWSNLLNVVTSLSWDPTCDHNCGDIFQDHVIPIGNCVVIIIFSFGSPRNENHHYYNINNAKK